MLFCFPEHTKQLLEIWVAFFACCCQVFTFMFTFSFCVLVREKEGGKKRGSSKRATTQLLSEGTGPAVLLRLKTIGRAWTALEERSFVLFLSPFRLSLLLAIKLYKASAFVFNYSPAVMASSATLTSVTPLRLRRIQSAVVQHRLSKVPLWLHGSQIRKESFSFGSLQSNGSQLGELKDDYSRCQRAAWCPLASDPANSPKMWTGSAPSVKKNCISERERGVRAANSTWARIPFCLNNGSFCQQELCFLLSKTDVVPLWCRVRRHSFQTGEIPTHRQVVDRFDGRSSNSGEGSEEALHWCIWM